MRIWFLFLSPNDIKRTGILITRIVTVSVLDYYIKQYLVTCLSYSPDYFPFYMSGRGS